LALSAKSTYKATKDTNGSDDETKGKKTNHNKGSEEKGTKSKVTKSSHGDRIGPPTTKKVHIDDNRTKDDQPFCETCGLTPEQVQKKDNVGLCHIQIKFERKVEDVSDRKEIFRTSSSPTLS